MLPNAFASYVGQQVAWFLKTAVADPLPPVKGDSKGQAKPVSSDEFGIGGVLKPPPGDRPWTTEGEGKPFHAQLGRRTWAAGQPGRYQAFLGQAKPILSPHSAAIRDIGKRFTQDIPLGLDNIGEGAANFIGNQVRAIDPVTSPIMRRILPGPGWPPEAPETGPAGI